MLRNSGNKFCNTALDMLHLLSVILQGRAPELDPILVEGKYDISGLIRKVPGNHPQNLASLFATLIDLLKLSQITREKHTQISLQAYRCDLITIHDMLMVTIVANQVHDCAL